MEADAILKMTEDAFRHCCFIIGVIVGNDDSTMQAVLKNSSIGAWGQVLKLSKGDFNEVIPVPSFLVYPYYHVKVVAKHIFPL